MKVKIAAVQPKSFTGNQELQNVEAALAYIDQAANQGAQFVSFPELYPGPFHPSQSYDTSALYAKAKERSIYIVRGMKEEVDGGYQARTAESVNEILERRQRESKNSADAVALVECLAQGRLPEPVTGHQQALLGHLRGFVVQGDNYARSAVATGLLKELDSGSRDLQRLGFDVLVKVGVLSEDEPLELERAGIPVGFPEGVVSEANGIDPEAALAEPGRRDLQGVPTITVDEEETADRDDALSLEIEPDGSYRVGIHIADAGALIPPGGAIDSEADRRMSTIYLPELKLPMVPPGVSEGKGSLSAGQPRAALSVVARISGSGDVLDWDVLPSVIRSQAALSYEDAEAAAADRDRLSR